jgi:hypothetical protein
MATTTSELSTEPGTGDELRPDHPRLLELKARYQAFAPALSRSEIWHEGYVQDDDIRRYRGDNAYLWQLRGQNMCEAGYALTAYYLKALDSLGLWHTLVEDGAFGIHTFDIEGKTVSRDLLDSMAEVLFLERHLGISTWKDARIVDIGAGYGRFAQRVLEALPSVLSCLCTDAIAVSTYLSECHLRFRHLENRSRVVPLDEIDLALAESRIDLAVNIHSFSECPLPAIDWWLALLERHRVRYLMIVPNALEHGGERLINNWDHDFEPVILGHGYRLKMKSPKFLDPVVQRHGINPTWHYLFEFVGN